MEVSRLQDRADDSKRKVVEAVEEVSMAKTVALSINPQPSSSRFAKRIMTRASGHLCTMFGLNTPSGTCHSLGGG